MLLVRAPRASIARVLAAALVAGAASIGSATAQDTNKAAELLLACQSEDGSIEKRVTACAALAGDKAVDVEMRVEAYLNLGLALETKGDEQAAVQAYTDTIALDATNSVAYFNRGNVLDRLGQADRALADYNKAIELEPTDGDYFNNRGLALLEAGDAAKALDDFNQAIRLGLNEAGVFNGRAAALEKLGKKSDAVTDYRKAIELEPGNADAQEGLKRLQ